MSFEVFLYVQNVRFPKMKWDIQEDVREARKLRDMGSGLVVTEGTEGAASLLPKCDELARMADALSAVLSRRTAVLALSQQMHSEISQVDEYQYLKSIKVL